MRKSLVVILVFVSFQVFAQGKLLVQGGGGKLFLTHTVAAKENWYSIGRIYNISPRDMAPFNGLTIQSPLSIGMVLKVPLTDVNFSQDNKKNDDEAFVPLLHTIKEKEGLFHVSQLYNKVPVANIRGWNNLSSDNVSNGTDVIIGYLKVKKQLSPLAGANVTVPAPKEEVKVVEKPAVKEPVKEEPKSVVKAEAKTPVDDLKNIPVKKEEPKVITPVKEEVSVKTKPGGYFSDEYNAQTQNGKKTQSNNGNAATFKSTSGWADAKYYVLMNNVTPGTIVKVSSQGKYVYAKVLGAMPEIKQNDGLLVRISNAAAKELNVGDKFTADVSWDK